MLLWPKIQRVIKKELCLQYITLLMTVLIFQFNPTDSSINNVTPGRILQLIIPSRNSYSNFFKQNIHVKILNNFSGTWYALAILFTKYYLASDADKVSFLYVNFSKIFLKLSYKWTRYSLFLFDNSDFCVFFFLISAWIRVHIPYICIHGLWLRLGRN